MTMKESFYLQQSTFVILPRHFPSLLKMLIVIKQNIYRAKNQIEPLHNPFGTTNSQKQRDSRLHIQLSSNKVALKQKTCINLHPQQGDFR